MTIREHLHRTWTVVGELTSRLCTFVPEPPERRAVRPEYTARFGIRNGTSGDIREHG